MNQPGRDEPFSESDLDSPEYRERLMRKLNCLIALLEVAMARVQRSLVGVDPDHDRLRRIQSNLRGTLDVCLRARAALERREALPSELKTSLAQVTELRDDDPRLTGAARRPGELLPARRVLPQGAGVEMTSVEERLKFERLGPISNREARSCDLEELSRLLQRS